MALTNPVDFSRHPKGINNQTKETSLDLETLRDSVNFDIDDEGKKKLRQGYEKKYSGTNVHSLWESYFIDNGTLKKINPDYTTFTIKSGLSPIEDMFYARIGDRVFCSNGIESGMILNDVWYEWGVPTPISNPTITVTDGIWEAGIYDLSITFLRNGEESGATIGDSFELTAGQGISLSNIPTHSEADYLRIYCTMPNGEVYYQQADITPGALGWVLAPPQVGKQLATVEMYNSPRGLFAALYNGRIFQANGQHLIFTEALNPGLMHYDNYITFPEDITVVAAVEDGIYVVSDYTYFLSGKDPKEFNQSVVYKQKGVPGRVYTGTQGEISIPDYTGVVATWVSTKGIVYGLNGGTVIPKTEARYALSEYGKSAATLIEDDGVRRLVFTLTEKGASSGMTARDKFTATVRTNEV